MKDIALYIEGNKVDLPENPDILFTYQRTDYENPTVVKNTYSKTLTIYGTQNNNSIFNHIWNIERVMDDNFILFNPSQKVQFELYDNSEIVETGYAKLDSISKDGYNINYNLTLYGGLGSFFYSLAYDADSDKEKTLADLNFTYSINPDDEFDFEINKNTVWNAWDALRYNGHNTGSYKKWDYINFIPAYNGLPDNFESDKVVMNIHSATGMSVRYTEDNSLHYGTLPTSVNNGDTTYTPHNGYLTAKMQRECDEWEMRDLRSYLQRPALSVKGLFEAICNPTNNGGYDVVLDPEFFSSGNPYYDKAWITLPMIDSTEITEDSYEEWDWYGDEKVTEQRPREMYLKIKNVTPFETTPDVLSINCEIHATITGTTAQTLYGTTMFHSSGMQTDGAPVGDWYGYNMTALQFYINRNGNLGSGHIDEISSSNRIILATRLNGSYWQGGDFNSMPLSNTNKQWCFGTWKKVSGSDYVWTMEDGSTVISVDLETNHINTIPMLGFLTKSICNYDLEKCGFAYDAQYYNSRSEMNAHSYSHLFSENPINAGSKAVTKGGAELRSFQNIKKKDLLGGMEGTPCDWMLSYCKLFGLFFEKDKNSNTIYIKMRKNWYVDETVDLEDLIDRSKEIKITPLTFESKWYNFNYGESEGKLLDSYKKNYSQDFGKQLIDTKYNFDADEIDILEGNSFNNGLTCLEKSNYFNLKYDLKDFNIFPCLYNWCTVTYFNEENTYDIYMALPMGTRVVTLNPYRKNEFYDFLPKLQFKDDENGPVDGDGVLVFFNGLKDTGEIDYWLTDDIQEMFYNSTNPCWLQTRCEWDTSWNTRIAIQTHMLPEFGRYVTHFNVITADWDFGYTKELYVPYFKYDVMRTPTMYENFWKAYIQDLYSVNTRKVDCYVAINSNDIDGFMKKFYWWDNSLWVCTKVSDYDICLDRSTLCSFTKVNDISTYFDTPTFDDRFFRFVRSDNGVNIPAQGTDEERSVYFTLDSSSNWVVLQAGVGYVSFDNNYPTEGTFGVGYTIKATFLPNYNQASRVCNFVAGNYEGDQINIPVWQDGYVKPKYLTVDTTFILFPKEVVQTSAITITSSSDWEIFPNSWTYFTPESGHSGTSAVTVSASTNNGDGQRVARIRVNNNDGLAEFITVKQKATDAVTLEQNEIKPIYTMPASGGNVHYKITSDVECTLVPWGGTENFAIASGQVSYNTTIQPTNGTNFWIHFNENTGTVTRNASFYAYYVDSQGGRHSVFPTIVPLPIEQEASGNTVVDLNSTGQGVSTNLGGAGMRWTATTNNSWITIVSTTGSTSDTSIQFTVTANSIKYRTGYIYVTYVDSMGYYCNETIVVNQQASGGGFNVDPTGITVDYRGGTFPVSVTSDTSFNVSTVATWIKHTEMKGGTFTISVNQNDGYERTAIVNVESGGQTKTVTVTQGSAYIVDYTLDYTPKDIVFEASGGSQSVGIRSNSDWNITTGNTQQ